MRAHYLQHVPFEGLGAIEPWLQDRGATLSRTRLFAGESLPRPDDPDILIVMGGPMSVNDEADLPWLVDEKRFIGACIEHGIPVLGICLGAQLIAASAGAAVRPAAHHEIGWWPVHGVGRDRPDRPAALHFPAEEVVFQWHGDTFDLPAGAIRLSESPVCPNQAFLLGSNVVGLQYHLETTPETAARLVEHCADELVDGPWIQDGDTILAAQAADYARLHRRLTPILEFLTAPLRA